MHACPRCGIELIYDARTKRCACPACGAAFEVKQRLVRGPWVLGEEEDGEWVEVLVPVAVEARPEGRCCPRCRSTDVAGRGTELPGILALRCGACGHEECVDELGAEEWQA